ncbi:MAG: hypothetical protein IJE43_17290 [Alphaproteobacteria bacterium]|nr:hypothetical protein [Alphaproteobacteria bacterium]MBQ6888560.1 hypothetical protein [Lachnospiraceae bacterium]
MSKQKNLVTPQLLGVDIPGQAEFISSMEKKVGDLLASKLMGKFRMLVDPNGFHYGFTYGSSGYYNEKSLVDIDRTLCVDKSTNQLTFSQQPLSILYEKILKNTGYHLSSEDQRRMNEADIVAQAYTDKLIRAFKNDFPGAVLPPDVSTLAAIFQYITNTFGTVEQVPVYYSETKNALLDYSAHANESYQLHSMISNAQSRLQNLIANIDRPSAQNGAMQTGAVSYHVGYSVPNFADTYASLTTDTNKIDISLEFSNFNGESSELSIDHQSAFVVPLPVFVFGRSDTKYTLNSLVTSQSKVSMKMTYRGITTFSPNPAAANATATSGWYDEAILKEIAGNTGKDQTGYCLINNEFDVKELFGNNGTFNHLSEFVICQTPTITLTMTAADTSAVSKVFEHDSSIDIDFFGFGISSSQHHYKVQSVEVNSQMQTATITLSAPKPSATASVETEVAYVLGGVVANQFANLNDGLEKILPFAFSLPSVQNAGVSNELVCRGNLKLLQGSHTMKYYVGKTAAFSEKEEEMEAVLSIWYYYNPAEKSIWLSDANDFTEDQTKLILYHSDGKMYKKMSSHSCMNSVLEEKLNTFMEKLIKCAEEHGLTVIRRRSIPDEMKDLCYYRGNGEYKPLGSTFWGSRNISTTDVFVNAIGTSNDIFHDPMGQPVYMSWISLWSFVTMQQAQACTNCLAGNNLYGAHVLLETSVPAIPAAGEEVDILPLCSSCNNSKNEGAMQPAFNTMSMVMIW